MSQLIHPLADDLMINERDSRDPQKFRDQAGVNVGRSERLVSTGAGAVLVVAGLVRGSLPGLLVAGLGGGLMYRGIAGRCPAYDALGVNTADQPAPTPTDYFENGIHVEECFTVHRSPWELYQYWRNFNHLPLIMSHLESVTVLDDQRSRWVAKAPAIVGGKVEWDAEIINDEPNALIAWRSLGGADVDNAGSVRFVPAGEGTDVKVVIDYIPPAGRVGSWVVGLFGEKPEQQIHEDLQRFKQTMESGAQAGAPSDA
jgi:uncharacterized membrane protein